MYPTFSLCAVIYNELESRYHNTDVIVNSGTDLDLSASCRNMMRFHPITVEFMTFNYVQQAFTLV